MNRSPPRSSLTRFAWLAVVAAVLVIGLKGTAYAVTGSVGLLSDALESLANLAGAIMALAMLTLAARPPDEEHAYGHGKAEYFASGFEGALILLAAVSIGIAAVPRLLNPRPLEAVSFGLLIAAGATVLNFLVARVLVSAGVRHGSITLEATARHLMTDVWTSLGVIVGVGATAITGWYVLDPLIAIAVAVHILVSGLRLIGRSALGLLDTALPVSQLAAIQEVITRYEQQGVAFHALRTRQAGRYRFISMHVLVPGVWSVQRGHELLEEIEERVREVVPLSTVFTHLEPIEDPVSFADAPLVRERGS
jgi:cation diffusion facilitator family transporter